MSTGTTTQINRLLGKGREAIDLIVDPGTLVENQIGSFHQDPSVGPGAVIGTAMLKGREITIISNDSKVRNPRFPVVFAGVIGLEEGYKMATAVYQTMLQDADKPLEQKRPIVQLVDSPGNAPGKLEEIIGMNKATGAYQLALAEARKAGHPIVAMIIGRAISGAFLCHGLQADRILSLPAEYGTMIHVMPLTSISRITKLDIERLEELSKDNPVFASGAEFFYRLGGVEQVVESDAAMRDAVNDAIDEIYALKKEGRWDRLGPPGRGAMGEERGGRKKRKEIIEQMKQEFAGVADKYIGT